MTRSLLGLTALTLCAAAAAPQGQPKTTLCHRGVEITIADPAVINAHLDHGDCIGLCVDCLGRCCLGKDGFEILTQSECATVGGRFQWDQDAPCFTGGD